MPYFCPDCGYEQEGVGKCPGCGVDLSPASQDEEESKEEETGF